MARGAPDGESVPGLGQLLLPGEHVLWSGAPDPSALLTSADLFLVPFSLVWTSFSGLGLWTALASGAPAFAVLFLLGFVGIGLFLLVGRFPLRRRTLERTRYVLTDRRALCLNGSALTAQPADGGPSQVRQDPRRGTVTLAWGAPTTTFAQGTWSPTAGSRVTFTGGVAPGRPLGQVAGLGTVVFERVRDVEGLLAAVRTAAGGPGHVGWEPS